jgi:type I restriction enzyme S subunit
MPDDWEEGFVNDIVSVHDNKRIPLSSKERNKMTNKIYPYYGATSLMDYVDNYIFEGKYLLLGEDGTVIDDFGFPILQYVWGKFWVNNHAHILTGKNGYNVESLYLFFKHKNIKSIVTGAVQAKISQNNLKSLIAVIPPENIMKNFNQIIKPLFDTIRKNFEETKILIQLRDTLLPKLMSGEIDVENVDISTDKLLFNEDS